MNSNSYHSLNRLLVSIHNSPIPVTRISLRTKHYPHCFFPISYNCCLDTEYLRKRLYSNSYHFEPIVPFYSQLVHSCDMVFPPYVPIPPAQSPSSRCARPPAARHGTELPPLCSLALLPSPSASSHWAWCTTHSGRISGTYIMFFFRKLPSCRCQSSS